MHSLQATWNSKGKKQQGHKTGHLNGVQSGVAFILNKG